LSATKSGKPSKPKPPPNSPNEEQSGAGIGLDELLKRMLSMKPAPHAAPAPKAKKKRSA